MNLFLHMKVQLKVHRKVHKGWAPSWNLFSIMRHFARFRKNYELQPKIHPLNTSHFYLNTNMKLCHRMQVKLLHVKLLTTPNKSQQSKPSCSYVLQDFHLQASSP